MGTNAQLAAVKAACDVDAGVVSLPVSGALVTYLKPFVAGAGTSDPAGFFLSGGGPNGIGLFVQLDPSTVAGGLLVGDLISLNVDFATRFGNSRYVAQVSAVAVSSRGNPVSGLAANVSTVDFLGANAVNDWESRLVSLSGTIVQDPTAAGAGYKAASLSTTGTPDAGAFLRLRLPATLMDSQYFSPGCTASVTAVPMWRFADQAQPSAFVPAELTGSTCPPPVLLSATATSVSAVTAVFSRDLAPLSVLPAAFTIGPSGAAISVSTATLVGPRTVSLVTSTQTNGAVYTLTANTSVTDRRGTPCTGVSVPFTGGMTLTCHVVINEVQMAGPAGANDEFVELFNPCSSSVVLDGRLVYRSQAGVTDLLMHDFAAAPATLASNSYLLLTTIGSTAAGQADRTMTGNISISNGALALRDPTTTIIDAVGWGMATNGLPEGTPAPAPMNLQTLSRLPNGVDTNSNVADFAPTNIPTPKASN